jgi:hypothetical protein
MGLLLMKNDSLVPQGIMAKRSPAIKFAQFAPLGKSQILSIASAILPGIGMYAVWEEFDKQLSLVEWVNGSPISRMQGFEVFKTFVFRARAKIT